MYHFCSDTYYMHFVRPFQDYSRYDTTVNIIPFAHPVTNQRRSNEFRKESIYILVRPCYHISMVDENGVVRARTKGRDTQDFSKIRDTNLQPFPPGKAKIIGKISIK